MTIQYYDSPFHATEPADMADKMAEVVDIALRSRAKTLIEHFASKPGLRGKVNAKCIECIYDDAGGAGGTWRQQVEACTATSCPLYDVRPVSTKDIEDGEIDEVNT